MQINLIFFFVNSHLFMPLIYFIYEKKTMGFNLVFVSKVIRKFFFLLFPNRVTILSTTNIFCEPNLSPALNIYYEIKFISFMFRLWSVRNSHLNRNRPNLFTSLCGSEKKKAVSIKQGAHKFE